MKPSRAKSLVVLYFLSVLGMYAAVVWNVRRLIAAGLPDFAIYYCVGTVVRQGLGHKLYDPTVRFDVQQQFATAVPLFRGPLPWTHPPFEALFFVPFSFVPYHYAYVLWNVLSLILWGAALRLLRPLVPQLSARAPTLWILGALAFFPVFFNLLEGQDALVLLFLYAAATLCLSRKRDALAGAMLALGLFKFHLVVPFVFLMLLQKRWKLLYGFVPGALLVVLASIPIAGFQSFAAYPRYVFYWEDVLAGSDRVPAGMPNLRGLMYVLLPQGSYVTPVLLILSLGLLLFVIWRCRLAQSESLFSLTLPITMIATVLLSYHVVSYDLSILLVPISLVINQLFEAEPWRRSKTLVVVALAALFFSPLELFLSLQYKQFALMGLVLLLWLWAMSEEVSLRVRQ